MLESFVIQMRRIRQMGLESYDKDKFLTFVPCVPQVPFLRDRLPIYSRLIKTAFLDSKNTAHDSVWFSRAHIRTKLSSRRAGPGCCSRTTASSRSDSPTGSTWRHRTSRRPGRRARNRNQGRRSRSPFPLDKPHTSPSTTHGHSHAHHSSSRDSATCFPQLLSDRKN